MLGVNPRELHSWRTAECGGACERVYKADEVDAEIERLREALERIDAHLEVRPDSELGQLQVISHNHSFGFWLALKAAREVLRNERKPFETNERLPNLVDRLKRINSLNDNPAHYVSEIDRLTACGKFIASDEYCERLIGHEGRCAPVRR